MGIFSRFGDIINANLTALLDRAEDPAKMIRMMIQEMEETLIEVRTTSARVIADRKELERRMDYLRQESENWEGKARLALSKNREDLARAALAEKSAIEENLQIAGKELKAIEEQLEVLHEEIAQLQQKLDDAKAKQKSLVVREQTARSRMDIRRSSNRDKLEEAFNKFEAYERKMDDLEAQVESYDLGRTGSLMDEFSELERNDKVEQALADLKERMNADSGSKN
ncbi:Phage shock protein A (IM30), suppresses sigma54-dependent transcription [Hahella chejuensis KCTC 2396]|uniref:Phage shock protein A (IM30), suppresses sigma54-dependent transcription n=1 Tax=Hahella chejuensis (strain KCTC 2396) TaxID=349521 RepID=Q2SB66_HAHCH|nr:phage shock protein PspA [Hahella chejuensis]ABC32108.1 Phage shock protein A (IM30), suppresses sigma54-dependent transcription [Hahella chejuensis KCTC 2396]